MPYCQNCGGEVSHVPEVAEAAIISSDEVEIARINAERDVEVARISAGAVRAELATAETIAETEAEAEVEVAEAEAEVIGAIIAEGAEPEPEPEPVPVVMETPEPEADQGAELEPPSSGNMPSEHKPSGWWDAYK